MFKKDESVLRIQIEERIKEVKEEIAEHLTNSNPESLDELSMLEDVLFGMEGYDQLTCLKDAIQAINESIAFEISEYLSYYFDFDSYCSDKLNDFTVIELYGIPYYLM